jgi:hypothetical protein
MAQPGPRYAARRARLFAGSVSRTEPGTTEDAVDRAPLA